MKVFRNYARKRKIWMKAQSPSKLDLTTKCRVALNGISAKQMFFVIFYILKGESGLNI